jgi:hypothetical protein
MERSNNLWYGFLLAGRDPFVVCFVHYDGEKAVPLLDGVHNVASYAAGKKLLSRFANDLVAEGVPTDLRMARAAQVNGDFRTLRELAGTELARVQVDCAVLEARDTLVYVAGLPMLRITYELESGGYVAIQAFITGISTLAVRTHFLSHRSAAAVFRTAPPTRIAGRLRGADHPTLQAMWEAVHRPQAPVRLPAEPTSHVRQRSVTLDVLADATPAGPTSRVRWLACGEARLYEPAAVLAVYHYGDDFFWVQEIENKPGFIIMTKDGDAMATYPEFPSRAELGGDLLLAGCLHD